MIAIVNTWSDLSCCHGHFRERAEAVRRGVWDAGGFPVEVPVLSLAEPFQKPSAMMFRNLLASRPRRCCAATRSTAAC